MIRGAPGLAVVTSVACHSASTDVAAADHVVATSYGDQPDIRLVVSSMTRGTCRRLAGAFGALIVVLWRAGLRRSEALALAESQPMR